MDIIVKIKQKKELKSLSNEFVKQYIQDYKKQNPRLDLSNPKAKEYKLAVKEIRAKIRKVYGLFRTETHLETLDYKKVLTFHASTKERLLDYLKLYKKIFDITGKPKTIIDLGCGLNPFSIPFMKLSNVTYYAYDLSLNELDLINKFFKKNKIKGKAIELNVLDLKKLNNLPKADVSFLFKMSAVIDKGKGHKKTEDVIDGIPAKYVVVSFPTITMSGKPMNAPRRRWMEWLCDRRGWKYQIIEFKNEIFYVLKK